MKRLVKMGVRKRLCLDEVMIHPYFKTPTGTTTLSSRDTRNLTEGMFRMSEQLFGSNEAILSAIGNLKKQLESEERTGVPSVSLEQFQIHTLEEFHRLNEQLKEIYDNTSH